MKAVAALMAAVKGRRERAPRNSNAPGRATTRADRAQLAKGYVTNLFRAVATFAIGTALAGWQPVEAATPNLANIDTIVVIYLENWSFDGLFARFPGANGISRATPAQFIQLDRDGSVLSGLPAV